MSPRLGLAVLACLLAVTGCNTAAVDGAAQSAQSAAAAAAGRLSGDAAHTVTTEVERQKKAAEAEAARRAAALKTAAQKALQEQTARAAAAAKTAADKAAALAAAATAVAATTAPTAPTSAPLTAGDLVPTTAPSAHTVTGVLTSTQVYDVTYAYPPCATDQNQVGQPVQISAGAVTVAGSLTGCTWKGDYRQASPVFALEVPNVPEAPSYDVTIGTGTWTISGPTLAASGWKLALN